MPNSRKPQKPPATLLIGWASTGSIITIQDPSRALMAVLEGMHR